MDVSHESRADTRARLLRVLAGAELHVFEDPHVFETLGPSPTPPLDDDVLALVRDDDGWSRLVPDREGLASERFRILRFHFPAGLDNSGFVGWLASRLKRTLGTGIFVVCGMNPGRGGIYDYWGCPWELGDAVVEAVERWRDRSISETGSGATRTS